MIPQKQRHPRCWAGPGFVSGFTEPNPRVCANRNGDKRPCRQQEWGQTSLSPAGMGINVPVTSRNWDKCLCHQWHGLAAEPLPGPGLTKAPKHQERPQKSPRSDTGHRPVLTTSTRAPGSPCLVFTLLPKLFEEFKQQENHPAPCGTSAASQSRTKTRTGAKYRAKSSISLSWSARRILSSFEARPGCWLSA